MKLVIVGGVAGGASAAARARRLDEGARIVMFERGEHVSFANCGLPYYIGDEIRERRKLLVSTPEMLRDRFRIDVRTLSEVTAIDRAGKKVEVKDLRTGEIYTETYDKLILSPGAKPIRPPLPGIDLDSIYTLRNIPDTDRIKERVDKKGVKSAVIVGGGFIGLEMAENLHRRGLSVTIVEMLEQVMAPLDYEMAAVIHNHLREKGVKLCMRERVEKFTKDGELTVVTTATGREIKADMVILSIGVRPESGLAEKAGLEIGGRRGIATDDRMRTSDPDIYAVGDAVEVNEFISGQKALIPLAGPANKQGRIAADNAMGRVSKYKGTQGTGIVKVFDLAAASTGAGEKFLKSIERPFLASYTHSDSHAGYYPGAEMISLKLLFDPEHGKLLGAQAVGKDGVDKRIDVLATAIRAGMTVYDLEELELAYAPPFGSAKDPVNMAGYVASNIMRRDVETVNWRDLEAMDKNEYALLDLRNKKEIEKSGRLPDALHVPVNDLRDRLSELDRDKTYIVYCAVGQRAYYAFRILAQHGFKAKNLSGGFATWSEPDKDLKACDAKC
jgi:NADPH-dependent 2,4-dienoyl-CoA reductase/sulfur reductase-like enzyme/rhodanese-related sulfurtransferase